MSRGEASAYPEGGPPSRQLTGFPERTVSFKQKLTHLAAIGLAAVAADVYMQDQRSGERLPSYQAIEHVSFEPKKRIVGVTYNVAQDVMGHVDDFEAMDKKYGVDFFLIQEATSAGMKALPQKMPGWNQEFVYGDGLQDQGVAIISKTPITQVHTQLLPGSNIVQTGVGYAEGLLTGLAYADKKVSTEVPAGRKENRSNMSAVLEFQAQGWKMPVGVMTSHIGAPGDRPAIHLKQLQGVVKQAKQMKESGMTVVMGADLNADPPAVETAFHGSGFTFAKTGSTSVTSGRTIDYIATHSLLHSEVFVDTEHQSDHHPIVAIIDMP